MSTLSINCLNKGATCSAAISQLNVSLRTACIAPITGSLAESISKIPCLEILLIELTNYFKPSVPPSSRNSTFSLLRATEKPLNHSFNLIVNSSLLGVVLLNNCSTVNYLTF